MTNDWHTKEEGVSTFTGTLDLVLTICNMYSIMYMLKEGKMTNTNITNFRKNLFELLEQTIMYNEPVNISTKIGNAVVMSEEDYNGLMETLYLCSIPGLRESILEGANTPTSELIPESEVQW